MKTPRTLLAVLFAAVLPLTTCEMQAQSPQPTSPSPVAVSSASLIADPNPVAGGIAAGKTTITWQTGTVAVGDVYVVIAGKETLFASGPKGSQEAPWIKPGSTEFRLYNQADHKLLAQLTVTMPLAKLSANSPPPTPVSSVKPK